MAKLVVGSGAVRPEHTDLPGALEVNRTPDDASPRAAEPTAPNGSLAQVAGVVLERAQSELRGSQVALLLADRSACVVDVRAANHALDREITSLGVAPGVRLGEAEIGTNAVGTPLETRQGVLLRGPEHSMPDFHRFTCYGHPIVHPVTRRLKGVLDFAVPFGEEDRLIPLIVRRMVVEIEERLAQDATHAQRQLLAAFQAAARTRGGRVMVIGHGLLLATQLALELLEPADHAALRVCAEESTAGGKASERLTLVSGQEVRLTCDSIDGANGVLIDIVAEHGEHRRRSEPAPARPVRWPLLVVGEPGTGRTTEAGRATGPISAALDAAEIVRQGESSWAVDMGRLLEGDGAPVVVENLQLLSEPLSVLMARCLRTTRRHVVVTSTPGAHLAGVHAPVAVQCSERRDLTPLRGGDRPPCGPPPPRSPGWRRPCSSRRGGRDARALPPTRCGCWPPSRGRGTSSSCDR